MATRRKKGLPPGQPPKDDRPAPEVTPQANDRGGQVAKKRAPSRAAKAREEIQAVGADIVPTVTIEARSTGNRQPPAVHDPQPTRAQSLLGDQDIYLFNEGSHNRL